MTKKELVATIAKETNLTQKKAQKALDSFIEITSAALKAGDKVTLVGFGSFRTVKRAARTGRNPQTGQEIKIAAKSYAKFRPGKVLKDMVCKPVQAVPEEKVIAKVEVSGFLKHRKLEVGKSLDSLVERLKGKKRMR